MRVTSEMGSKLRALAALVLLGGVAAGCTIQPASGPPFGHGGIPIDYAERHPILLTRATSSLPVEVGTNRWGITGPQRSDIENFARAYALEGEGVLAVNVPTGAANGPAATHTAREVRDILVSLRVNPGAVVTRGYRASPGVMAPPIMLSYARLRASVPNRCANSTDLDMDSKREQWENFGCSSQANFAAMIASPNDLNGLRPMDRPYATRRYQVLDRHGQGQDPTTVWRNQNAGAVSRVGAQDQ